MSVVLFVSLWRFPLPPAHGSHGKIGWEALGAMQYALAAAQATGGVVVSACIGAVASKQIPHLRVTVRSLSLLLTSVFTPALLFDHVANGVTFDLVTGPSVVLMFFSLVANAIGLSLGYVVGRIFFGPRLAFLVSIAAGFQNTIVLPVALISSLRVAWMNQESMDRAVLFTFIYNLPVTVSMWSVGNLMIERAAEAQAHVEARHEAWLAQHHEMKAGVGAANDTGGATSDKGAVTPEPLVSITEGSGPSGSSPSALPPPSSATIMGTPEAEPRGKETLTKRKKSLTLTVVDSLLNGPLLGTVLGLACGVGGVNRAVFEKGGSILFTSTFHAIAVLGRACVPGSLLVLGANLSTAPSSPPPMESSVVADGAPEQPPSRNPPATLALILTIAVIKLVVSPLSCAVMFHVLATTWWPSLLQDRIMILTLFVELAAPSAIATSLLCNIHDFMPATLARCLMFQYLLVIPTSATMLFLTLWYLDVMTPTPTATA